MKNRLITGILAILLGGFIAFGPLTIFPVCGVNAPEQTPGQTAEKMGEAGTNSQATMQNAEEAGGQSDAMPANLVMKCHWTARVELGAGILIALLGVLLILFRSAQVRLGLSLSLILNGTLALLAPTALIGVCGGAHMTCRTLTLPALAVLSAAVIFVSAVNAAYLAHRIGKGQEKP